MTSLPGLSPRKLFLPIVSKVEHGVYRLLKEEKDDQQSTLLNHAEEPVTSSLATIAECHCVHRRLNGPHLSSSFTEERLGTYIVKKASAAENGDAVRRRMRPSCSEFNYADQLKSDLAEPPVTIASSCDEEDDDDCHSEVTMCPITPCDEESNNSLTDKLLKLPYNIAARLAKQLLSTVTASYSFKPNATEITRDMLMDIFENLDTFIRKPVPPGFTFRCRLIRNRKGLDHGLYPTYYLHLERKQTKKLFLLAARKRKRSTTANFLISTDPTDLGRNGRACVGKLRSNAIGTRFILYDNGLNPKRGFEDIGGTKLLRQELCALIYEPNVLGMKGPRRMTVVLPSLTEDRNIPRVEFRPTTHRQTIIERWKSSRPDDILELHNKEPVWNEEVQAYVLNFHGRVTQASVKNFQIINRNNANQIVLQFGRIGDDSFTLDFSYPFSPLQAFGIALTSFDSKLACE